MIFQSSLIYIYFFLVFIHKNLTLFIIYIQQQSAELLYWHIIIGLIRNNKWKEYYRVLLYIYIYYMSSLYWINVVVFFLHIIIIIGQSINNNKNWNLLKNSKIEHPYIHSHTHIYIYLLFFTWVQIWNIHIYIYIYT